MSTILLIHRVYGTFQINCNEEEERNKNAKMNNISHKKRVKLGDDPITCVNSSDSPN